MCDSFNERHPVFFVMGFMICSATYPGNNNRNIAIYINLLKQGRMSLIFPALHIRL